MNTTEKVAKRVLVLLFTQGRTLMPRPVFQALLETRVRNQLDLYCSPSGKAALAKSLLKARHEPSYRYHGNLRIERMQRSWFNRYTRTGLNERPNCLEEGDPAIANILRPGSGLGAGARFQE